MKKNFKIIITLTGFMTLVAMTHQAKAQANNATELAQKLEMYTSNHLPEKIFLHTDKSSYLSNELCWFKIYNVDGVFHTPLDLSKIAYVEIVDNNAIPVVQVMSSIENGIGHGSIKIPATVKSGEYRIRAYTNWMKNFGADYFFEKKINLVNTQQIQEVVVASDLVKEADQLQIFPEGGNLLNGIENRLVFKYTNAYGKGKGAMLFLVNELKDTIEKSTALSSGIGSIIFTPYANHQYTLIADSYDEQTATAKLPNIYNQGYSLQLTSTALDADSIQIKIGNKNTQASSAFIIVHNHGVVKQMINPSISEGINEFKIATSSLGNGINIFTLFDENKKPVSERLFFKYPKDQLDLDISIDAAEIAGRKKMNVKLLSKLQDGNTTASDLSMSVYKIDSIQNVDPSNIINYLWLSSDLVGKVDAPTSFFDESNAGRWVAMENLMLTQGWRKYNWENVLSANSPAFEFLPEVAGKIITGKIIPKLPNAPLKDLGVYLSIPSTKTQFRSSMSDASGHLLFQFPNFYTEDQVIAQIERQYNNDYKLSIDNPFVKSSSKYPTKSFGFGRTGKYQLNQYHRDVAVQDNYNFNLNNRFVSPSIDSSAFYYQADVNYDLDDYARFNTIEEVLREYVSPVKLSKTKNDFDIAVYDEVNKRFFNNAPLILLDGLAITDFNKFMEYDPLKIKSIDIVDRMYFLGSAGYSGILNFTTYRGNLEGFELDPKAIVLDYKGLQSRREFLAPVYETKDQINSHLPDFRHLLYWDPSININAGGIKDLSFYTSDVPGKYVIVLQGISPLGKAGYKEISFEVN